MDPALLAYHMHTRLGLIATMLGWRVENDDYDHAVERVRRYFDVDSTDDVEDIPLLLAIAEREAWREVVDATVGFHTISTADGERRDRRQVHENAVAMYERAERRADEISGASAVRVSTLKSTDPYQRDRRVR